MIQSYRPLLRLSLAFESLGIPDTQLLKAVPSANCAKLLRRHRCELKDIAEGLIILAPVDAALRPTTSFAPSTHLELELKIVNADFQGLMDLNQPRLEGRLQYESSGTPVFLGGTLARLTTIDDLNGLAKNPIEARLVFQAAAFPWIYYVLCSGDRSNYTVVDENQQVWQNLADDLRDPVGASLTQGLPGTSVQRFLSPTSRKLRSLDSGSGVQLRAGNTTIFENLPSPGCRNFIRCPEPTSADTPVALFQIVKDLRRPSTFRS